MERRISVQAALCVVGCLHLITFASLLLQSPLLFGQNGLQPVAGFLQEAAKQELPDGTSYARDPWAMLQSYPTLLWFHELLGLSAEAAFSAVCIAGIAAAFVAACGAAHPLMFAALWLLYLSAVSVGQAFLPQAGDAVLLEVTFACIWLSVSVHAEKAEQPTQQQEEVEQDVPQLGLQEQQQQEASAKAQPAGQQPAILLLRWLLFKLLLLSSSTKAFTACASASSLAECYRVLAAHGQPHVLTWLSQALPSPVAAALAALAMLELPASFLVLCPAPIMQAPLALLLALQLARGVLGSSVLLHLAAAALCIALLDDSWLVPALQRVARCFARSQGAEGDADGAQQGGLQRTGSNDSLASIMSFTELPAAPEPPAKSSWNSVTLRTFGGSVAALVAALALSNSGSAGRVLWLPAQQLTNLLGVLVPAAAALWLAAWAKAALQSYKRTSAASAAAVAVLQRKLKAAEEAAARADAAADMPAAGSAARTKPVAANGPASPDGLLSPPVSPRPIAVQQLVAAAAAAAPAGGEAAAVSRANTNGPTVAAAAGATDTDDEGSTPCASRRRAAAKGTPPPRRGRLAKAAAAPAGEAAAEADGVAAAQQEEAAAAAAATPARRARRGAVAARGKKAAADQATDGQGEAAAGDPAAAAPAATAAAEPAAYAATPAAAAAAAATPATAAPATAAPATAGKAAAARAAAAAAASRIGLGERLAPRLVVVGAVSVAVAALLVFLAGLPAVLLPAGWSQATLKFVPGLLDGYRACRTFGIIASSSTLQRAWAATAAAAASDLPGSYLAFELATSDDGWDWRPVQFRHGGFGTGSAGPWGQALLGQVRGVYEPRLQGRLAAAAGGALEDNLWLLGLADKLLEGSPELAPYLEQPLQPHAWVKIDLVCYTPSSLPGVRHGRSGWLVHHVAEVLPVMPRGDPDLKDTLLQLGLAPAAAAGSVAVDVAARVAHPGWLLAILLLLVALRHCLLAGGLVYSARA